MTLDSRLCESCRTLAPELLSATFRQHRLDEAAKLGIPKCDIAPVGKSPQEFVLGSDLKIDTVLDFVGTRQTFEDAQHIGMYQTRPANARRFCTISAR